MAAMLAAGHDDDEEGAVSFLTRVGARKVALQFPDDMLHLAPAVCARLQGRMGASVDIAVLGDTSYAPCCVDEVAAAHMAADAVVHFGPACLSAPPRMATHYVFNRLPVDTAAVAAVVAALLHDGPCAGDVPPRITDVVLLWQSCYAHAIPSVLSHVAKLHGGDAVAVAAAPSAACDTVAIASPLPHLHVPSYHVSFLADGPATRVEADEAGDRATPSTGGDDAAPPSLLSSFGGLTLAAPLSLRPAAGTRVCVVHIGAHPPRVRSLLYTTAVGDTVVVVHDPAGPGQGGTWHHHTPSTLPWPSAMPVAMSPLPAAARLLASAFMRVEAMKKAERVGIVSGTLGVAGHGRVASVIAQACARAGKAVYRFVVGKLTPTKLGNFPEIDAFVLISCPENSLLDADAIKAFAKPVVTPFEALLACDAGAHLEWEGCGAVAFPRVLSLAKAAGLDGCGVAAGRHEDGDGGDGSALVPAPAASGTLTAHGTLVSSAAEYHATIRRWKGMEYGLGGEGEGPGACHGSGEVQGATGHSLAIGEGMDGIAVGYAKGDGGVEARRDESTAGPW